MAYVTHEDLRELRDRIKIGTYAIKLAEGAWQDRCSALAKGLTEGDRKPTRNRYVAHQDRYLSVARYCDEARELLAQYKGDEQDISYNETLSSQSERKIYSRRILAIDPHVIRAYCEFWEPSVHRGFEFLDGEFSTSEELEGYRLFVYASLLTGGKLAFLEAARSDLSKMIAFFFEEMTKEIDGNPIDPKALLKEIERVYLIAHFERNPSRRLEFLHEKAVELASVKAGAAGRQKLALTRLNRLMRSDKFYAPEALVRDAFASDLHGNLEDKLSRFTALVHATRSSPTFADESYAALMGAYDKFKEISNFDQSSSSKTRSKLIRGGELIDLSIVLEVNTLNHALRLCEIDAEIVYVTLSSRIYDFLSGFGKNDILAPIIHPRTALTYRENKLARTQRNALQSALSSPIAFAQGISSDDIIRPKEIDDFNTLMSQALQATRDAFAFSVVAEKEGVLPFLNVFESIFRLSEDEYVKNNYNYVLKRMASILPERAMDIGDVYKSAVENDLFENTFNSYIEYSAKMLSWEYVAIRKYSIDENTIRYAAVPLTRGYRHMFFMHNNFIDAALGGKIGADTVRVGMSELLQFIDNSASQELKERNSSKLDIAKAYAVRAFGRSCYAACTGEWNLVLSLVNQGLRELHPHLSKSPAMVRSADEARGHLIAQELHFLRHLAERSLSESTANEGMHGSRLARAASALFQSSLISATLPREFAPFNTPYSAMSMRDALAALGLLIEWHLKGVWRQVTTRDRELSAILAQTENKDVAWYGLDSLTSGLQRGDEANWSKLVDASEVVCRRAESCLLFVSETRPAGHSVEMWRYIALRAQAMVMAARQAKDVLGMSVYAGLSPERVEKIRDWREAHNSFIANCQIIDPRNGSSKAVALENDKTKRKPGNHFLDGLLAIEDFVAAAPERGGHRRVEDLPTAMRAFADLDENCSHLYRFGFSRMFLRKIKEQLVGPVIENLSSTYQTNEE